jgi:hypothetical protein
MIKTLAKYTKINIDMKQGIPDRNQSQKELVNGEQRLIDLSGFLKNPFRTVLLHAVSQSTIPCETKLYILITETRVQRTFKTAQTQV